MQPKVPLSTRQDAAAADGSSESGADVLIDYQPRRPLLLARGASRFEIAWLVVLSLAFLVPGLWSYTLIDPWETHYAEVARRMLQDHDLVHMQWQNEGFRSKPVLTFWLIAGGLRAMGLAADGGFSGEMTSTDLVMLAVRLPFVLFGVMGVVMLWWMLARLASRRVAWLSFAVIMTTPFFFLVARQAITDMPLLGCLMGAIACLALALNGDEQPPRPVFGRLTSLHLHMGALGLLVGWQIIYYAIYFATRPVLAPGIRFPAPHVVLPLIMLLGLVGFIVWATVLQPTRTSRQVYMYWFYTLIGVSVLAKGPVAIAVAGMTSLFYLIFTWQWRLLAKVEIPRGVLIAALIAVPWHVAMWLADGRPFIRDYFGIHLFGRTFAGVHGDRGTFNYVLSQVGIGMWPWIGLLPAAVAGVLSNVAGKTREGRVRLLVGIWAITGMAFFSMMETKFHHYVLPIIPALGVLIAFWLDDLLAGRVRHVGLIAVSAAAIVLLLMRDFMGEQEQLIELFIYRYDRLWPSGEPWNVDLSDAFLGFGLVLAALILLAAHRSLRRVAVVGFIATAALFALWTMNVYMRYAGTHWGMHTALQTYYQQRQIHGIDLHYHGARQLADEWAGFRGPYEIQTVVPEHLSPGQPMTIAVHLADQGKPPAEPVTLYGSVARMGQHGFWVDIPPAELSKLAPLIQRGASQPRPAGATPASRRPWKAVNADRLLAWQLYWRGENFWSGDEIWGRDPDMQTAFKDTDNKAFLAYLKAEGRAGRRYFLVTESGRASTLRSILPTNTAKETYQILDRTSNKFTLLSFTL